MSFPTLACKYSALYIPAFGHTQPAPLQFNQITIKQPGGTWLGTFACDPDYSAFLPSPITSWMAQQQFSEIWPQVLLILVVGFCIRMVRRVFADGI